MPRRLRSTLVVLGSIIVLLVAVVVGLRSTRGSVGTPSDLRPNMMTITNGHVSITAARVDKGIILFDAGQDPQGRAMVALLHAMNATEADVHDVFLTHGHGDHLSAIPMLPHARIWAGADDVALAAGQVAPDSNFARVFGWIFRPPAVHVSNPLTAVMDIPVGGIIDVRCFPMPGHTPGSYAYLYNRVLFMGDTLALNNHALAPPFSIFDVRPKENRAALRNLVGALGTSQVDRLCMAHGGCTDDGDGRALLEAFVKAMPADVP